MVDGLYNPPSTSGTAGYVNGGSPMTTAALLASYPASSATLGLYARVSDLYGSVDEILRCRFDGVNYRWVPQRESFSGTMASTGGAVGLTPLVTPPVLILTGTLTANMIITPSAANAYLGQLFRLVQNSTLGVFTGTITGLVGSNVSLLGGGTKEVVYGPNGWVLAS